MKRIISGVLAIVLTSSLVLAANPSYALAWDQGTGYETHQEINKYALDQFFKKYSTTEKYANGAVYKDQTYWGPKVACSSLLEPGHVVAGARQTFEEWVIHGGFSADEPNLWASVRHFYEPLATDGHQELTDHNWVHGMVYNAISAKDWAFSNTSNPFGWKKGLEYYKKAMEIPEDSQISQIPGSDFRDPNLTVESPAKAREAYLAKAFRSLGKQCI